MSNFSDLNIQNFQSLIENYESTIKEITDELDQVETEQNGIGKTVRSLVNENLQLTSELNKLLSQKIQNEVSTHQVKYKESDFIINLQDQIKSLINEKESAIQLWRNSTQLIDHLEDQLKVYEDNSEGYIPKSLLHKIKSNYEDKLKKLEETVSQTKNKLEKTISVTSKELQLRDGELCGTLKSQESTFQIVRNLEDEILKLQHRLSETNKIKTRLEKVNQNKIEEITILKKQNQECKQKVAESVEVVESALKEKDAALKREARAKGEVVKLSKNLAEVITISDQQIQIQADKLRQEYEQKIKELETLSTKYQNAHKIKTIEVKQLNKQVALQKQEIDGLKNKKTTYDDTNNDKILMLEKHLEETFQKLLLSEKQNIQLKAEKESIKNDLQQMSGYFERDIKGREAESVILKDEIKKLKIDLLESRSRLSENADVITKLTKKISEMDRNFKDQIDEAKSSFQKTCKERKGVESVHKELVEELQEQLASQIENNQKWRNETKNITERLEKRIMELKSDMNKIKNDNKSLVDKLKNANVKMREYRKFLESISSDVNKISNITLPEKNKSVR